MINKLNRPKAVPDTASKSYTLEFLKLNKIFYSFIKSFRNYIHFFLYFNYKSLYFTQTCSFYWIFLVSLVFVALLLFLFFLWQLFFPVCRCFAHLSCPCQWHLLCTPVFCLHVTLHSAPPTRPPQNQPALMLLPIWNSKQLLACPLQTYTHTHTPTHTYICLKRGNWFSILLLASFPFSSPAFFPISLTAAIVSVSYTWLSLIFSFVTSPLAATLNVSTRWETRSDRKTRKTSSPTPPIHTPSAKSIYQHVLFGEFSVSRWVRRVLGRGVSLLYWQKGFKGRVFVALPRGVCVSVDTTRFPLW